VPSVARTRVWRAGVLEAEDFPLDKVSDYLAQDDCVVWADLCAPDRDDMERIADELSLDPLAVEDAVERHERPKVDRYPTHLFVNAYGTEIVDGQLRPAKISAFVLPRAFVTVRHDAWFDMQQVVRSWAGDHLSQPGDTNEPVARRAAVARSAHVVAAGSANYPPMVSSTFWNSLTLE
jgi:CorA-like Mg2+ transporter protein